MPGCKEFCDHLSDYLDGEMGENECRLVEKHLDNCPPCALYFESLKTTVQICCEGVSAEMPQEVKARLKEFLKTHCEKD